MILKAGESIIRSAGEFDLYHILFVKVVLKNFDYTKMVEKFKAESVSVSQDHTGVIVPVPSSIGYNDDYRIKLGELYFSFWGWLEAEGFVNEERSYYELDNDNLETLEQTMGGRL